MRNKYVIVKNGDPNSALVRWTGMAKKLSMAMVRV
jgi:hypothetical protein